MFISTKEKNEIVSSIMELQKQTRDLTSEVLYLKAKLKAAEGNIFVLKQESQQSKPKKQTTAAQRAKQREYMRAYKARKKAEKLAQATA